VANNNHVAQATSGSFQLTLFTSCSPSFFFLENMCDYSIWFSIKARLHIYFFHRFSQHNPRVLRALFFKEKTDPSV